MTDRERLDIGAPWRRLAAGVTLGWVVWAVALAIIIGEVEPFIVILGGIPVIAWAATRWKPGKVSYTVFGALGLLVLVGNVPFLIGSLTHPESALGFNIDLIALLLALLQIAVGVSAWAQPTGRAAVRAVQAAGGMFAIGFVVSIVAMLGLEDDVPQAGDILLLSEKLEFAPVTVSAPAGTIAVFVDNTDPGRHTFTIRDLDVDVELPAGTKRRIEFAAAPGTYEIICAVPGHEQMKATIIVTG